MKIISVNVGMPCETIWKGMAVQTGIFKRHVDGPVMINKLGLAGDGQAGLTVHGGEEKAVYAYPAEHYEYWRRELGETQSWGKFGENLTTAGLLEATLSIGDRLKVGLGGSGHGITSNAGDTTNGGGTCQGCAKSREVG